ncbi:hypothetical protein ACQP1W_03700 [Spirillospora sp. CA-255316]
MADPAALPQAGPEAEAIGDKTMVVPPPNPSWTSDAATPAPPGPGAPADTGSAGSGSGAPSGPLGFPEFPEFPGSPSESTAPWAFDPSEDSGGFQTATPPPPPAWAAADQPPAPPAPAAQPAEPASDGGGSESIVPESWYARPRKPDDQQGQDQGLQQWAPQPSPPGGGAGTADATMLDSPYPNAQGPADATQLDQPMMNMGAPMGPALAGGSGGSSPQNDVNSSLGPPMGPYGAQGQQGPYGGPQGPMGNDMGPGGMPPGYPPPSGSSGKASKPLLITVSALVVVALVSVGLVLWPKGEEKKPPVAKPSTPAPSNTQVAQKQPIPPAARQQAVEVNKLLNSSADTKRQLAGALRGTARCETLPAAIKGFQVVAQRRTNQVRRTQGLKLDQVRNGERMRVTLRQAFQASLEADQRLLAWANAARKKCRGKPRPDVSRAPGRMAAERKATIAKKQFVALWNPVAKTHSLPPRIWNGL